MAGFHILLVKLKIMHKKFSLLGFQQWCLKSKIIALGSVNQAAEGKHYLSALRLHKQSVEYLLIFQSEKIIANLPANLMEKVENIRLHASFDSRNEFFQHRSGKR